jgi:four helix bundle protein
MPTIPSFKDMPIWQRSMRLTIDILNIAAQLPPDTKPTLGVQLQQTAIDIPTLLASGSKRGKQGFQASLLRGRQSAAELECLMLIVQQAYPQMPIDDMIIESADIQTAFAAMSRRLSGQDGAASSAKPKTV